MRHVELTDDDRARVALYALGALPAEEALAFERHLSEGCERCREEAAAMRDVCDEMALAPAAVSPPSAVRARVMAEARHGRASVAPTFAFTLEREGDWVEIQPGVQQKMLVASRPGDASSSYLIRLAPGATAASHRHEYFEHCYVIAGDLFIADRHIRKGDYHYAPKGSLHHDVRSETGCLLLIVETR
jgi:anti-sigma factor ChrR (cupin superfamily)